MCAFVFECEIVHESLDLAFAALSRSFSPAVAVIIFFLFPFYVVCAFLPGAKACIAFAKCYAKCGNDVFAVTSCRPNICLVCTHTEHCTS